MESKFSPFYNIGNHKEYEDMNSGEKLKYDARQKYIGQIYHTKQGYDIEIIDYFKFTDVVVRFIQGNFYLKTRMNEILKGSVVNPFHRNKFGGYIGIGPYSYSNSKKAYNVWFGMLSRCGNTTSYLRSKSYENVSVSEKWLNFQNFAGWINWNIYNLNPDPCIDYELDKDILQLYQENKIYSDQTCCLIPKEINIALSSLLCEKHTDMPIGVRDKLKNGKHLFEVFCSFGKFNHEQYLGSYKTPEEAFLVYKEAKENYIKGLADYYYSINAIMPYVRDALYRINIRPY